MIDVTADGLCGSCGGAVSAMDRFCRHCGAARAGNGGGALPQDSHGAGGAAAVPPAERQWAVVVPVAAFAAAFLPFGWIIGPLVIWLMKRHEMPFVDVHGRAAVNFFISITLWGLLLIVLLLPLAALSAMFGRMPFPFVGAFPLLALAAVALGALALVEIIRNAVRASNGQPPQYHLSLILVR